MWKLFITIAHASQAGVSSQLLEFDSELEADTAYDMLNSRHFSNASVTIVKLYKR